MKTNPRLKSHARDLRKNMTPAERILWTALRDRRFAGYKFRRQQVVGEYVLDFYCSNALLALEIDGKTHLGKEESDSRRTTWLEEQNIKVLRFWNTQVYDELESALEFIFRECDARKDLRFTYSESDDSVED
jgi:very-short-patch-repair endonuclease